MFLSDVSIKRPVFATILNVVLIVFGFISYTKLGIDQFPSVDFPVVNVQVVYPGADPKSIEQKILDPLEKSLNSLEGLESLSSTAVSNVGFVTAVFKLEMNGDKAAQNVRDKVAAIQSQFPPEAKQPLIRKLDVGAAPVLTVAVASDKLSQAELSRYVKDKLKPALEQVNGIGSVDLAGSREREIQVKLDRSKVQAFGLSPVQVGQVISAMNLDVPSGKIENDKQLLRIRTEGTMSSAEQIRKIPIPLRNGSKIRLEDVASVEDTIQAEESYAAKDGTSAIIMYLNKVSGGNTVAIADGAQSRIAELRASLPDGVRVEITQDNSTYIKGSIDSVKFDLVLGAILAVVIVLMFLHDWRATLISACAIPTSVIGTLLFVGAMGFTLNILTTLALTLSIGILVDDAIVVIENIYRHLQMGKSPWKAAQDGTAEIGLAAIAITVSIVCVFIPVAFMEGIIGRFFYQFGTTVAFAVLLSLFVAFTLTPMMSSRLLKEGHGEGHSVPAIFRPVDAAIRFTERIYKSILSLVLRNTFTQVLTVAVGVAVLIVSGMLLKYVPMTFFPKEDKSLLTVTYTLKEGSPISETKKKAMLIDKIIHSYDGVKDVSMTIGADQEKKPNKVRVEVNLIEPEKRKFSQDQFINRLRDDLGQVLGNKDGDTLDVSGPAQGGGGRSQPIQVILTSNNWEELRTFASGMREWTAQNVADAVDVTTSEPPAVDEVRVVVDPVRAADLNLSTAAIGQTLRALFEGNKVAEIDDKGSRFDVRLKVAEDDSRSTMDLAGINVVNTLGQPISLASVATITRSAGTSKVERYSGQRQIVLLANFKGQALNKAIEQIEVEVKKRQKDMPSVNYKFEGQAKLFRDAAKSMGQALILAILLVYMVLCAQFESYANPFVILFSVPLSFSGAFVGLLLAQREMGIYSMIGIIMLVGLVTKNAILLVDFALQKTKDEGLSFADAMLVSGPIRLKPILMTTAAMIFGMLPIAEGHGVGGDGRAPMAITVIGGLVSSTVLTLVVIPCFFVLMNRFLAAMSALRGPKKAQAQHA